MRAPILVLPLLLAALAAAAQNEPSLTVEPAHPRQGDALLIRFSTPGAERVRVHWAAGTSRLFPQGGSWLGAVPISPDTSAGSHRLTLRFEREGREQTIDRTISVEAVRFPVQHLAMARSIARLYNFPGVENEERPITAAIHTVSPEKLWKGSWRIPAAGPLSTPYGVRRLRNGRGVGRHNALDIAAKEGTPVHAPAAGRVVLARLFKKYGNTVVLDHGIGVTSFYIHMRKRTVHEGQAVNAGDDVGEVGHLGVATGPHLHWGVYVQGRPVQPLEFVHLAQRAPGF